jgi:rhamnulokinase
MAARVFGAVDVGASGGRVVAGLVESGRARLSTVHRFSNAPSLRDGHLRWEMTRLYDEILTGLRTLARRFPQVESIGIDTWGVDYGLLDEAGRLLADPVSYRDDRTGDAVDRIHASIGSSALYAINGLQFLPFTTLYQLAAEQAGPLWDRVAHIVLLPDLFCYWLTGILATEITNASTSGLLDARSGTWSPEILAVLGIDVAALGDLRQPGTVLGPLSDQVLEKTGLPPAVAVRTVASHDTASAVVAVPAEVRPFVYVSSGTWSLVGTERNHPILTEEARVANFTNERGVDGRIRFLRNVAGLWLLQESLRSWAETGQVLELAPLLKEAAEIPTGGPLIDVDDPLLFAPGGMPERIRAAAAAHGGHLAPTPPATVRCILESLAAAYAATVDEAMALSATEVETINVVGGGSQNALLCQLTADLSGRAVIAGPIEATALGNVLVQARAVGVVAANLGGLRRDLARHERLQVYVPRAS